MLLLESSDLLFLDGEDRFPVGRLDNDGAAAGLGLLGLYWRSPIGGSAPERVDCRIEELEVPELETTSEVTTVALRVRAAAPGATEICLVDLGTGQEVSFQGGLAEIALTAGRYDYAFRVVARNSRSAAITAEGEVSVPSRQTRFFAVKNLFPLIVFMPQARLTFAARLTTRQGRPLERGEVASCVCRVYRLVRNLNGKGRVPCDSRFGVGAEVPLSAFDGEITTAFPWRRDNVGGNFRYGMPEPLATFCGKAGLYDVVFTVRLKNGASFSFGFSLPVGPGLLDRIHEKDRPRPCRGSWPPFAHDTPPSDKNQ